MQYELMLTVSLHNDLPDHHLQALRCLFSHQKPDRVPEDAFFRLPNWHTFLNPRPFVRYGASVSFLDEGDDHINIFILTTTKNTSFEIRSLLDWLHPFINAPHQSFIGYIRQKRGLVDQLLYTKTGYTNVRIDERTGRSVRTSWTINESENN